MISPDSSLGKAINLVIFRQQTKAAAGHNVTATKVIGEMCCDNDLAWWAGKRYRDVVLRCLRVEDVENDGAGDDSWRFL